GQQREREVAVSDRRAERARRRSLAVDVDPLPVPGRLGERVDALLGHLDPGRRAELSAGLEHRRTVPVWVWGGTSTAGARRGGAASPRRPRAQQTSRASAGC